MTAGQGYSFTFWRWRLSTGQAHAVGLALVLAIALVPRLLMLTNTVSPARDAFRFRDAADVLMTQAFPESITQINVHPVYPALLAVVTRLASVLWGVTPTVWLVSAQVLSLVAYLLFLTLAYIVGVHWMRQIHVVLGLALLAVIPRSITYSIDVLSDSVHAAWWMATLVLAVVGWQTPRRRVRVTCFLLAGLLGGVTYLTRIEGLLVCLAIATSMTVDRLVSLVPKQFWRTTGESSGHVGPGWSDLAVFLVGWSTLVVPYVTYLGKPSPRNSAAAFAGLPTVAEPRIDPSALALPSAVPTQPGTADQASKTESTLAAREPATILLDRPYQGDEGGGNRQWTFAVYRVVFEFMEETRILLATLAVVGAVLGAARFTGGSAWIGIFAVAGACAMGVLCQVKAGYFAGRYLMPVLPFVAFAGAYATNQLVQWLMSWPIFPWERHWSVPSRNRYRQLAGYGLVLGVTAILVTPGWFVPLHRHRYGHREAGRWLAVHSAPGESVFDPMGIAAFFASRPTWTPNSEHVQPPCRFMVVDSAQIYRNDLATFLAIEAASQRGWIVARWGKSPDKPPTVFVVALSPTQIAGDTESSAIGARR